MEEQADDVMFIFVSDVHLDRPQAPQPSTAIFYAPNLESLLAPVSDYMTRLMLTVTQLPIGDEQAGDAVYGIRATHCAYLICFEWAVHIEASRPRRGGMSGGVCHGTRSQEVRRRVHMGWYSGIIICKPPVCLPRTHTPSTGPALQSLESYSSYFEDLARLITQYPNVATGGHFVLVSGLILCPVMIWP